MDIAAIKRRSKSLIIEPKTDNKLTHKLAIRLNTTLHNTIHNYLEAMHSAGDYSYSSMADILRKVLSSMEDNSLKYNIIKAPISDEYIELTLRCTDSQKQFWKSLPSGNKVRILEKAIIAFLQH